jgi:hypothetical protein
MVLWAAALLAACGTFERGEGAAPTTATPSADDVLEILYDRCNVCHGSGGIAAGSAYFLAHDREPDLDTVAALITPGDPDGSRLLVKARGGESHGGGAVLPAGSDEESTVAGWIAAGAPR